MSYFGTKETRYIRMLITQAKKDLVHNTKSDFKILMRSQYTQSYTLRTHILFNRITIELMGEKDKTIGKIVYNCREDTMERQGITSELIPYLNFLRVLKIITEKNILPQKREVT